MSDRPQALLDVQELMKALVEDNVSAMLDNDGVSTRDPAIRRQLTRIVGAIGFNLVFRLFDDNLLENRRSLLSMQPEAVQLLDTFNIKLATAHLFASAVKIATISKIVSESNGTAAGSIKGYIICQEALSAVCGVLVGAVPSASRAEGGGV